MEHPPPFHQGDGEPREDCPHYGYAAQRPGSIRPFTERHYDLLIDTIGDENFFAQYIALRTDASLKVVYATPSEDPSEVFDLIIRGDGQVELKDFFNNIVKYLSKIQK